MATNLMTLPPAYYDLLGFWFASAPELDRLIVARFEALCR